MIFITLIIGISTLIIIFIQFETPNLNSLKEIFPQKECDIQVSNSKLDKEIYENTIPEKRQELIRNYIHNRRNAFNKNAKYFNVDDVFENQPKFEKYAIVNGFIDDMRYDNFLEFFLC